MADERDTELDDLMADAFGTTAEPEYLEREAPADEDVEEAEEVEETEETEEVDELAAEDAELLEDEDEDEDDENEDFSEEIDDTATEDDSNVGDEDAESEAGGDPAEGDGGEETLSDGQLALDMMMDQRLASYAVPADTFDPTIVGTEAEFVKDAAESFGDEYDEAYAAKMGKMAFKSAVRTAKSRHDAGAETRIAQRREADAARIGVQVNQLNARAGPELARVEARMAEIYAAKVAAYGADAANQIAAEVYFRRAGGKLSVPKPKAKGKPGVATRKAKAQKQKAVRAARAPGQIGRVRTPGQKKAKGNKALNELNAHLGTHKQIEDFFFGD